MPLHRSSAPFVPALPLPGMVYRSAVIARLARQIHQLKNNPGTLLITGETGTGKELVARALHRLSVRADQPFLACNCGALTPDLLESELYGYRRGAFTDARQDASGLIRAAVGGTLLLDEIGDLALAAQPKLLRFLDRHEIHPVGATTPEIMDVRVLAATHRDLGELVRQGLFREDLYYRLTGITLTVPPLRTHPADITLLIEHFLRQSRAQTQKHQVTLSPEATAVLFHYDYPGNVRQLANEIQRLVAFSADGQTLQRAELAPQFLAPSTPFAKMSASADSSGFHFPLEIPLAKIRRQFMQTFERELILEALRRHDWVLTHAARELGWERATLRQKMKANDLMAGRETAASHG